MANDDGELRPFSIVESITSITPFCLCRCVNRGKCVDHRAYRGGNGLFYSLDGDNGRSKFFDNTTRKRKMMVTAQAGLLTMLSVGGYER